MVIDSAPAALNKDTNPRLNDTLLGKLRCPECFGAVLPVNGALRCPDCGTVYGFEQGVAVLVKKSKAIDTELDYRRHYEADSAMFDYFEQRTGATAHSERRLREYVLSRVGVPNAVLDVGCGSAWVANALHRTKSFICSLDISAVNPAKAIARYPSPDHVGVAADSYALPFKDGAFDVVVASEIIEHVPDPQAFVTELMRVVAPGGRLVLSTPYKERLVTELCIHCNQPTPHNAHLHSFDERKLLSYFEGEDIARTEYFTFNNKLLLFGRTYPVLKLLPFSIWRSVDALANLAYRKPVNIVLDVQKS